jgi:hypothetical protein
MLLFARIVRMAASIVVGIIVVAIVLVLLGANPSNDIVTWFHDAGAWLAGPFKGLFNLDSAKADVAVNWGIAAIVYSVVAGIVVRLIAAAEANGRWGRASAV